jgi:cobalt/nickel transport system ATP-binding protein
MSSSVVISGLQFAYPDGRIALRGVNLTVEPGERVAILGPNGAGKTTLALHLNGIHEPKTGSVLIGDVPVTGDHLPEIRRRVGLVFQDSNDQLFMPNVGEDVAFGPANLGLSGVELDERVTKALRAVGGAELISRPSHHLSGGERRRAALATVLAMDPDVLVFDEPSSDLDGAGRRELVATLDPLAMTQLVITHDLPLALELCPRAVIMRDGRVVADGATRDLLMDAELLAENRLELPFGFRLETTPDR